MTNQAVQPNSSQYSNKDQKSGNQQQRDVSESKFSQLVCQVPQNVDPKQIYQNFQASSQTRKKVESASATPKPMDGVTLSNKAKTTIDYTQAHQDVDEPYLLGP